MKDVSLTILRIEKKRLTAMIKGRTNRIKRAYREIDDLKNWLWQTNLAIDRIKKGATDDKHIQKALTDMYVLWHTAKQIWRYIAVIHEVAIPMPRIERALSRLLDSALISKNGDTYALMQRINDPATPPEPKTPASADTSSQG